MTDGSPARAMGNVVMKVFFDWMVYIGIETARPNIRANRLSNCRHSTVLQGMASTRSKLIPYPQQSPHYTTLLRPPIAIHQKVV